MTKRKLNDSRAKALARVLAAATWAPRERPPVRKAGANWAPNMEQRAADLNGRRVKCLTADAGHVWIGGHDYGEAQARQTGA